MNWQSPGKVRSGHCLNEVRMLVSYYKDEVLFERLNNHRSNAIPSIKTVCGDVTVICFSKAE